MERVGKRSKFRNNCQNQPWDHWVSNFKVRSERTLSLETDVDSDDEPLAGLIKKPEPKPEPEVKVESEPKPDVVSTDWSTKPCLADSPSWFVYTSEDEVRQLIDQLNERGEREKELKTRIEKFGWWVEISTFDTNFFAA